jgi:hypothetical protein
MAERAELGAEAGLASSVAGLRNFAPLGVFDWILSMEVILAPIVAHEGGGLRRCGE